MSKNTAYIKEVGIKEDDIVFVKFKPLSEILAYYRQQGMSASNFLQESECDEHLTALVSGGYFKVTDAISEHDNRRFPQGSRANRNKSNKDMPNEISIDNHLKEDSDTFFFNENIVEEIRVEHDAQETYFSDKFGISVMKIDGALYINNERVSKHDGKLLDILESSISDLAIQRMLSDSKEKSEEY